MATFHIVGAGHMGGAIARALHASGLHRVTLVDTDEKKLAPWRDKDLHHGPRLSALAEDEAVILAIPPQAFLQFAMHNTTLHRHAGLVLSVMAGISTSRMAQALQCTQLVRSIPNTPSELGWGMSVYFADPRLTDPNLKLCQSALGAIGEALQVESESMLDPATALCGGGPAFVAYFLDGLLEYGVSAGFTKEDALRMALQVLRGTGELASHGAKPPMQICREVMTPHGTTERGINHLEEGGFKTLLAEALTASADRSRQLNSLDV